MRYTQTYGHKQDHTNASQSKTSKGSFNSTTPTKQGHKEKETIFDCIGCYYKDVSLKDQLTNINAAIRMVWSPVNTFHPVARSNDTGRPVLLRQDPAGSCA